MIADDKPRAGGALKPLFWIGGSRRDLRELPEAVKDVMGFALFEAQMGGKHIAAKPLKGFGGAGVLEIVEDDDGNTYRGVYTVKFSGVVYVLDVFQKKSKQGAKTPRQDIVRIKARLKAAEAHYKSWRLAQRIPTEK
ncbi:MAG: type II toxin-antitoxin system RelE/ParE family toxin [Planctomycetia bacterium]|nr:type II toxin-antitoxin system RelE/ParE family toxin [Planctomycetia bacterium]